MNDVDQNWQSMRRDIAARNRKDALDGRLHKLTLLITGLMAYSAFGNFLGAVMMYGSSPLDVGIGIILGVLYSLGAYRVWAKDDIRWWPVAVPAGLTIGWLLLVWWAAGMFFPIPIALNTLLLALVPIRIRATASVIQLARSAQQCVQADIVPQAGPGGR